LRISLREDDMPEDADQRKPETAAHDGGHIPITEEMDSARWTLPPATPLIIVVVALAMVIGVVAWLMRAKPAGAGAITEVFAIELPDHTSVMAEIHLRVQNVSQKPLWIRTIKATLKTAQGEFSDDAASAVDYQRYFQAFPELVQHQITPLNPETKIPPGAQQEGMIIVAFPVTKEQFDQRQSLSVTIYPYDQRPVVISEAKKQ
jgi:hypothetical protein